MKLKSLLAIAIASLLSLNVYAATSNHVQNGSVIGTMMVLNKNEVAAANATLKRNVTHSVRSFALFMQKEHTANLIMWKSLAGKLNITPVWSTTSTALKAQGVAELAKLHPLDTKQFQVAYINAMVKGHEAALQLIDQKLMKKASNPQVIADLKKTRTHVASHLQRALAVQKQLHS